MKMVNKKNIRYRAEKFINNNYSCINFSNTFFDECVFENCRFENVIFKRIEIIASDFKNCNFKNCNFTEAFMNINKNKKAGCFLNCVFINVNLSKVSFGFPLIENTIFENCVLKETNFDGSRFSKTIFKGDFISGWFNGYSIYSKINNIFFRNKEEDYPNNMKDVDFTSCNLMDVQFNHKINLLNCSFPISDNYILIKDLDFVYPKVKYILKTKLSFENYQIVNSWIDNFYYCKGKKGMKLDIINTLCRTQYYDESLYNIFFNSIKEVVGTG